MLRQRMRSSDSEGGDPPLKRILTFKLSILSLLGIGSASLIAVVWIFALGIIVGRGYAPEDKVPVLGKLMPDATEKSDEENSEIFKPEDLTFMSDLKTQPTLSTEAPASGKDAPQTAAQPPARAPAATAPAGTSAAAQPPVEAKASTERYNYVFQVIAYKKPEQADAFREKLEQEGLRTRLNIERDKQGKVRFYRVQVLLLGTDQDAENVKDVLARNGIKDPFLSSRKPAGR